MDTLADQAAFLSILLGDDGDWPDELSADLVYGSRIEWAEGRADTLLNPGDWYAADRWVGLAETGPIPIGVQSIRSHPYLSQLGQRITSALEPAALFQDDEELYFQASGRIGRTDVQVLFLAERANTVVPGPQVMPGASPRGKFTFWDWTPGDVAFQILGYATDPQVTQLMSHAKAFWMWFRGKPLPRGGRRRIPLGREEVFEVWRRVAADYERRHGRSPDQVQFVDELKVALELPSLSVRTFRSWLRDQALEWPLPNLD